jgi:predicted nucleotidyltransferase
MRIDMRPQDLKIVQNILRAHLPATARAFVFGSRATGKTKRSSDLDLAIDLGRILTREENADLADAFDESDLPYRVDVVDLNGASESFRAIIERDRTPLPIE